ncbi:putative CRISPR-associated protein [bacterium]|nr:putative CRISPR-associated protein [bacterium]
MKEFHIITVGTSIITNAQRRKIVGLAGNEKVADERFWEEKIDNPNFIEKLVEFVKENPKSHSAEMNTFLRVTEKKKNQDISVYFVSTRTKIGELCKVVLEKFLKEKKYNLFTGFEISGYFWESAYFNEKFAKDSFKRDISALVDRLMYLANKKKEEGFKVYFNPTGGLKAHVIACALAGFLTNSEIYYMNEEFKDIVFLPFLLYLPKGKELEVLNILSNKILKSGEEAKAFVKKYKNEIYRLKTYGFIEIDEDEGGRAFRVRITNKGKFLFEELKGAKNGSFK